MAVHTLSAISPFVRKVGAALIPKRSIRDGIKSVPLKQQGGCVSTVRRGWRDAYSGVGWWSRKAQAPWSRIDSGTMAVVLFQRSCCATLHITHDF